MKMKNKRGMDMLFYSLMLAFFLGIIFFIIYYYGPHKQIGNYIGQYQFSVLNVANKAESALLYIDQSAKYSMQQAVYDLASQGGYYEPPCGTFSDVSVWAVIESQGEIKQCYPSKENVKQSFLVLFNDSLGGYLANYPDAYIPADHTYQINDNQELIGKATDNIVIKIVSKDYEFKPEQVKGTPSEIYQQAVSRDIGQPLLVPMSKRDGKVDIETIQTYHPEVWSQYLELCRKMQTSPGVCQYRAAQCCVTSGYRHPQYNTEEAKGAKDSAHLYGLALDIHVGSDINEQLRWAKVASSLFTRVAIYPGQTNLHVDMMPLKDKYAAPFMINVGGTTKERAYSFAELENKATKYT